MEQLLDSIANRLENLLSPGHPVNCSRSRMPDAKLCLAESVKGTGGDKMKSKRGFGD